MPLRRSRTCFSSSSNSSLNGLVAAACGACASPCFASSEPEAAATTGDVPSRCGSAATSLGTSLAAEESPMAADGHCWTNRVCCAMRREETSKFTTSAPIFATQHCHSKIAAQRRWWRKSVRLKRYVANSMASESAAASGAGSGAGAGGVSEKPAAEGGPFDSLFRTELAGVRSRLEVRSAAVVAVLPFPTHPTCNPRLPGPRHYRNA